MSCKMACIFSDCAGITGVVCCVAQECCRLSVSCCTELVDPADELMSCLPDMELGHWVTGSFGSSFTSGSPGHHFDPVSDPSFSSFRKNAQNAKRTFEMMKCQKSLSGSGYKYYKYSYLLTYLVEYSIRYSTDYSSSKKIDSHTATHKSTFGVHYRTGSTGSPGRWIPGSLGRWVTKCDPVPCRLSAVWWRRSAVEGAWRRVARG